MHSQLEALLERERSDNRGMTADGAEMQVGSMLCCGWGGDVWSRQRSWLHCAGVACHPALNRGRPLALFFMQAALAGMEQQLEAAHEQLAEVSGLCTRHFGCGNANRV